MVFGDVLGRRALYTPERLAIVNTGKDPELRLSYRAMNERADRLARWLSEEAGVREGDRVAILARDGVEHLELFCACAKLGAVHAPLNTRLHWREIQPLLEHTAPKALCYSEGLRGAACELQKACAQVPRLVHLDGPGTEGSLPYDQALAAAATPSPCSDDAGPEAIAAIVFTGGTTGLPKGAQISHRMIAWNTLNTVIHDLRHEDVYLNVFPLFHTGGLFVYTVPQLILGGTTVLMPQFDPERVLALIERERVTVFAGVPTMYQMLTDAPNWGGRGPLEPALLHERRRASPGAAHRALHEGEGRALQAGLRDERVRSRRLRPGAGGRAPQGGLDRQAQLLRRVGARVADQAGRALGPDAVGELLLRGPSLCSGYFGDREASAALLDEAGWFHTGDLARYDREG